MPLAICVIGVIGHNGHCGSSSLHKDAVPMPLSDERCCDRIVMRKTVKLTDAEFPEIKISENPPLWRTVIAFTFTRSRQRVISMATVNVDTHSRHTVSPIGDTECRLMATGGQHSRLMCGQSADPRTPRMAEPYFRLRIWWQILSREARIPIRVS